MKHHTFTTTCQFEVKPEKNSIFFLEKNWFSEQHGSLNHPEEMVRWLNLNSPLCGFGYYAVQSWKGLMLCVYQPVYPACDENFVFLLNNGSPDAKNIVHIQPSPSTILKVQFFDMNGNFLCAEYKTRAGQRKKGKAFQSTDFYPDLVFFALQFQNHLPYAGKDWKVYHSCLSEDWMKLQIKEMK